MSTNVTLHAGPDVAYFTSGQGRGGCAGAMSYYTAAGEPPGQWTGNGAAALGLAGQVDPKMIERLYQENIGPGGELLVKRRPSKAADEREQAAVAAYLAAQPYASATELAEVRVAERGRDPHQVPYFDLTVSAVKSVSVLHASYRVCARQARDRGDQNQAAALGARAFDGVWFWRAKLRSAKLLDTSLKSANLAWVQLQDAGLTDAEMQDAFLAEAQLQEAVLMGAQLQRADLSDAHLEGAYLAGADLQGAKLHNTQLQGADLVAYPNGEPHPPVRGLTASQLAAAVIDATTRLPDELREAISSISGITNDSAENHPESQAEPKSEGPN